MVSLLLKEGADPSIKSFCTYDGMLVEWTPIELAHVSGDGNIVTLLQRGGTQPASRDAMVCFWVFPTKNKKIVL